MGGSLIGFTLGILFTIIGIAELVPAAVDFGADHSNAIRFFHCAIFSVSIGMILVIANWGEGKVIKVRQAFLLTTASWCFLSLAAALPLYLSDLDLSFVDAVFEAVSGITTTGSTVLSGLDRMTHGVLIWRSMMQWIGGIGVIAFAIIFLPFLRIGGMQLFQSESSDRYEKVMPSSGAIVISLFVVYCTLTVACISTFAILGMTWFDAFNHAMTTVSTGGYSTHDLSFGHFDSAPLEVAATLFMFLGGVPFVLYVRLLYQGRFSFFEDDQFRVLLMLLSVFVGSLTVWLWWQSEYGLVTSLRHATFNVVSVITTTGYATADYTLWGPFASLLFFFMTYFGACAGSTSGGFKVMRLIIVARTVGRQFRQLLYPHGTFITRYQGRPIESEIRMVVLGFLSLYVLTNVLLALALSMLGLDFGTSISAAATALANVGPGIGDIIGPAGNFSTLPDAAKWLLCAGMLLGRLEILTVLVLVTPGYWRH